MKGKKSGNPKGQHNTASQGGNGKRKVDGGLDFVANTNTQSSNQRRKGKTQAPQFGGPKFNLEAMMNQPYPKHGTQDKPASHLWKDCFIMREYRNSNFFQNNHGPMAVQGPALTDLVLEAAIQALAFRAKVIKVVSISNLVKGISSNSLVIRVIQSS